MSQAFNQIRIVPRNTSPSQISSAFQQPAYNPYSQSSGVFIQNNNFGSNLGQKQSQQSPQQMKYNSNPFTEHQQIKINSEPQNYVNNQYQQRSPHQDPKLALIQIKKMPFHNNISPDNIQTKKGPSNNNSDNNPTQFYYNDNSHSYQGQNNNQLVSPSGVHGLVQKSLEIDNIQPQIVNNVTKNYVIEKIEQPEIKFSQQDQKEMADELLKVCQEVERRRMEFMKLAQPQ